MNTPNVHAGRLERRVRMVGRETMPGIHGFCSFSPFGAICGVSLLRLTALDLALCPWFLFGAIRGVQLLRLTALFAHSDLNYSKTIGFYFCYPFNCSRCFASSYQFNKMSPWS